MSALNAPALDFIAVTPNDGTDLNPANCRALFIGTGGNVSIDSPGAAHTAVVWKNVPSGTLLPVQAKRVRATGTTATDIVAVY